MSLLNLICLTRQKLSRSGSSGPPADLRHKKWLPLIDADRCIGCERCVNTCEHGCLEMIWSFSTLTNPHTCCSEAHCVEACPEQIIHMAWVPVMLQPEGANTIQSQPCEKQPRPPTASFSAPLAQSRAESESRPNTR